MAPTSLLFAQIDEIIAAIERNRLSLNPAGLKILSIPSAMSSPEHLKKIRVGDRMAGGWYGRLNLGSVCLKEGAPGGVQRAMLRPE